MYDFECHYREERWQTAQYFEFVTDFLTAAQRRDDSDDECDPPPCPTTPYTETTEEYLKGEWLLLAAVCGVLSWHVRVVSYLPEDLSTDLWTQ